MATQTIQQPQIFYQPPQDPGAAPDLASIPALSGAPSGPPPVFASAPAMPRAVEDPLLDQIGETSTQLRKLQSKDANPYGSPNNHPGIGGKILHALSVAGNIAGDIFAPSTMAMIPQTDLGRRVQESGLSQRLMGLQQEDSEDQARAATTAKTQEETAEEPDKDAAGNALTKAQTANLESETTDRDAAAQNPALATAYAHAVNQAIKEGRDPQQDPIVQSLGRSIVALQPGQNKAPEAPKTIQLEENGKPHQMGWNPQTNKYDIDMGESGEKPPTVNVNEGHKEELAQKQQVFKTYQPVMDSAERMNVMTKNYEDAVKNHNQQAMLSLLYNHMGMTMGLQKGARMTQQLISEAQQSQPWLQGIKAKFDKDGVLTGVVLSPPQMRDMVSLAQDRYKEDVGKARNEAGYLGATDDGPKRTPGAATINYYVGLANGDAQKAKQLAAEDGWSVK
jgi:hypothetical protein